MNNTEFTLENDGFIGSFSKPETDKFQGKAVILFGGSDGNYELTKQLSKQFVERGMSVLSLAYFNLPGLPESFEEIPIEYVERAAKWLLSRSYRVGLWGISMGAELALLAASLMPDIISSVVAVCPINVSTQGFSKRDGLKLLDTSSFSWRGKALDYADLSFSLKEVLKDSIRERGICLRSCYEEAVVRAPESATIKVENISGPILVMEPEHDTMWPSEIAAKRICRRLNEKGFKYPVEHVSYEYASHLLVPGDIKGRKLFLAERKFPGQCQVSQLDSFERTLRFWEETW